MSDRNNINPLHYKGHVIHGVEVQPADIIVAYFRNDGLLSQAAKYLLRAGKKTEVAEIDTYDQDLNKALWWIARTLIERGCAIELPPIPASHTVKVNGRPVILDLDHG